MLEYLLDAGRVMDITTDVPLDLTVWKSDVLHLACWGRLDCLLAVNGKTTLLTSLEDGKWGRIVEFPSSEHLGPLSGLACTPAGSCTGFGFGIGTSADAYFLYGLKRLDATRPRHAHQTVSVSLSALSCPATGACVAGGALVLDGDGSDNQASLVRIQRGEPKPVG